MPTILHTCYVRHFDNFGSRLQKIFHCSPHIRHIQATSGCISGHSIGNFGHHMNLNNKKTKILENELNLSNLSLQIRPIKMAIAFKDTSDIKFKIAWVITSETDLC